MGGAWIPFVKYTPECWFTIAGIAEMRIIHRGGENSILSNSLTRKIKTTSLNLDPLTISYQ